VALSAGTRIGSYEITARIGVGGMGEVYRARDTKLHRDVALKVLPDAFIADPDRLARFKREAHVLAALNHPNIAAIYGLEESGSIQALVLELIEGPTLADRIADGPIPIDETVRIATQIAGALEAAHDQGIIHRDLKPANIKVRHDGAVKVLDFGLAKALEPPMAGANDATASPTVTGPAMTQLGMILGTAAYMSPEQAKAFAYGGIHRVGLTGGVATMVCMPRLGPASAGAPFGMTWDSTGIVVGQGSGGIVRCPAAGGAPEQLATVEDDEEAHGPQLLLGGSALLFTIAKISEGPTRWDTARIVMQSLPSGARKTIITGGTHARYLPTGHLVYASRGILFAVSFDPGRQTVTGEPVPVIQGVRGTPPPFATGAVQFVTSSTGDLLYVPGPTGTSTDSVLALADRLGAVTRLPISAGSYHHVRASPDGGRLAIGSDDGREAIVWIYEMDGKSALRRLTFGRNNRFPIWSPDGRRVAFQSDREGDRGLFVQSVDGTGAVDRLTKAEGSEAHVPESWSPDGRHILFSVVNDERYSLFSLSVGDKKSEPYGDVESFEQHTGAVFSADGRWVAYSWRPQGLGLSLSDGIYVQPFPATGARYQVPKQEGSRDFHPVWAPNGKELLYVPSVGSGQIAALTVAPQPTFAFGNPVNCPARVTAARLSSEMRAYDVLPDGRFVGLIPSAGLESSGAATEMRVVLNWFEELKARVPIQ